MSRMPDMPLYFWWRRVLREYPGGLVTRAEAARVLRCSMTTIANRIQAGKLSELSPPGRVGASYVPLDQLLAWIEARSGLEATPDSQRFNAGPLVRELTGRNGLRKSVGLDGSENIR